MSFETVTYELNGNVATVTMNRPDALNALSLQLTLDLSAAIQQATADGARAVVLTGNGRAFCSGGDLREMQTMWETEGRIEAFLEDPLAASSRGDTSDPRDADPVCRGCQRRLCRCRCKFCPGVRHGDRGVTTRRFARRLSASDLSPDCGGTFFLPRAIGEKLAAELFMTGDAVSAERAVQIGMINSVVPAADLQAEAETCRETRRRPDRCDRPHQTNAQR